MTMAELLPMAEGRERSEWRRTAQLAHLIANASRDSDAHPQPYTPDDFFPYPDEHGEEPTGGVEDIREAFLGW